MYALKLLSIRTENNATAVNQIKENGEEENEDRGVIKKAKGIKKSYLLKKVKFNHYYNCLFGAVEYSATFNTIRSVNHNVYSVTVTKKSLSSRDNKRVILEDGIHTLPYGHYSLR